MKTKHIKFLKKLVNFEFRISLLAISVYVAIEILRRSLKSENNACFFVSLSVLVASILGFVVYLVWVVSSNFRKSALRKPGDDK